ncbi:early nodulin-55-1-like [Magnolia sinica]|uniref:early nodulin-55-1-like n=1 Tax=Magnolia sinica TaxID=86752 RepID=UPI002659A8C2|nr:early nodulin-55-1-like [Magnolia sinica]
MIFVPTALIISLRFVAGLTGAMFVYWPIHDVIEVNERAYNTCSINNPIRAYNDGESVVLLDRAGTRYFICGTGRHCRLGMRMQVDVLPRPEAPDDVGRNRRPQPPPKPLPPVIEMPSGPTTSASPPPQYGWAARAVAFADGTCFISGLLSSSILPLTMLLVLGFVHSYD